MLVSKIWENRCRYAGTRSLEVKFTESLTVMSGVFAVIVLSVLTGLSHMTVLLLSLFYIIVSGLSSCHLSVMSISWSLQMLQWRCRWRYTAASLCLEMYSVLANTSHPDTIWSTVSSCCEQKSAFALHLLATYYFLAVSGVYCLVLSCYQ